MDVSLQQVTKRFGATPVLQDISFEIRSRELFFLLGPSGCGKTTLLRLIAGFYEADAGELRFGGRRMNGVPPHRRNTGMVFQNYALWPHLTVAENVAYGLQARGMGQAERTQRVRDALAIVQMEAWAGRAPNQLSGGQQQRVALARALVIQPDVLLLDEPLSNLDARLRLEMREEIRRIHEQTRITTIYVTHDQKESLSLADRLAVMRDGRLEQLGSPRQIYRSPANRFVADFIGETNWLAGTLESAEPDAWLVRTEYGLFRCRPGTGFQAGQAVWLGFRPEAVEFRSPGFNMLSTTVGQATYLGETEQYRLRGSDGLTVTAVEQNPQQPRAAGARVEVHVRPENLFVLDRRA